MLIEIYDFIIKFLLVLFITPFMGYGFLKTYDHLEKLWKTKERKKRWMVMCVLFFILAVMGGWLR